ncbi:hypothetical protein PAEVO_21720 [Paenibacillus sp. GM2FR]|nr:hypothetical protein PAEVO_21720 [Paenibacillus sp. GM2FR]
MIIHTTNKVKGHEVFFLLIKNEKGPSTAIYDD